MPSFEYTIDEKSRVGARFLSRVKEEIQRAFSIEKRERKLTQQSVAQKLGVNRSVVNRQLMGYENMTTRSIAEMLWAIGWEPHFEVRPIEHALGNQKAPALPKNQVSTKSSASNFIDLTDYKHRQLPVTSAAQ